MYIYKYMYLYENICTIVCTNTAAMGPMTKGRDKVPIIAPVGPLEVTPNPWMNNARWHGWHKFIKE
jgi:hypothetical protein